MTPVKHWFWDNWAHPIPPVPAADWHGWEARYDNDSERGKRTTRDLEWLPDAGAVLARMRDQAGGMSRLLGYPVTDDPTLHGGGLHVTAPGGHLSCHLDYDRHPKLPHLRRAVNLIWFGHERWEPEWGGEFFLADALGNVTVKIAPVPGRLLAFEVGDTSYHGHMPTGRDADDRVSLAVYFLNEATAGNTRQRALFMPTR